MAQNQVCLCEMNSMRTEINTGQNTGVKLMTAAGGVCVSDARVSRYFNSALGFLYVRFSSHKATEAELCSRGNADFFLSWQILFKPATEQKSEDRLCRVN